MNRYETLFILRPDATEAQRQEVVERLRRLAENMGASEISVEDWGLRDLAYLVRKQSRGHYLRLEYTARPEVVNEIERTLKLADEVLRLVSVRLPKSRKESAVAKPRPVAEVETPSAE